MALAKRTFIPPEYRPYVPGTRLNQVAIEHKKKSVLTPPLGNIVIIAAKEDVVPDAFLAEIHEDSSSILHLYYDDLGLDWDFSYYKNHLILVVDGIQVVPKAIYHRHPGLRKNCMYYDKHAAFLESLELWPGKLLGLRYEHFHNSSKMYQAIASLRWARGKQPDANNIKIPRSFFLKGSLDLLKSRFHAPFIVKSCSSWRSRTATESETHGWQLNSLVNLPTLFQEHIDGKDLRIHLCAGSFWSLAVQGKDHVDYRYSSRGSVSYELEESSNDIKNFCSNLAYIERNSLIGIDFLVNQDSYFCLESNPGPGWSTFRHSSKKTFAHSVLKELDQ